MSFAGVVLAGGASTRMGADKATLEVAGRGLLDAALDALQGASADPIVVVGGSTVRVRVVPDSWPGEGPLGGLITGLDEVAGDSDVAVVLACDLPHIDAGTVSVLVDRLRSAAGSDAAVPLVGGRRQSLAAAYRVGAREPMRRAFEAGERSVRGALSLLTITEVSGLPEDRFVDVDSPEDVSVVEDRS